MYKVLLVDDEPWVLLGLENNIPWKELGLQVCAKTTDPTEALNIIINKQPDIVITDIKMPKVSGIDLMCYSREQGITCDFIVFSGYSDFEYAKSAIKYGVFSYLLKPLDQKELIKTLNLLIKNIDTRKYIMREESEALFFDGKIQIDSGKFPDKSGPFCILTGYITFSDKIMLDKVLADFSYSDYRLGSNKFAYLIKASRSEIRGRIESLLKSGSSIGKEYLAFGLSNEFTSKDNLKVAFYESDVASHDFFVFPERRINEYRSMDISCCNQFLNPIYTAIDNRDYELAENLIQNGLRAYCDKHNLTIHDFSYMYNRILMYIEKAVPTNQSVDIEYLSYSQISQKFSNFNETVGFLLNVLEQIRDVPVSYKDNSNLYETFDKIIEYINCNYRHEITLSELSDKFFINMTYICDLFRKKLDTTFSKYLTNLRLEKAYHMICTTGNTLSEIAESVGYRDYFYFIKQFKKKYGITPGQLRKEKMP